MGSPRPAVLGDVHSIVPPDPMAVEMSHLAGIKIPPELWPMTTIGIPRYIENFEDILQKCICLSILHLNLASKKTLARSKKHKIINITLLVPLQEKN